MAVTRTKNTIHLSALNDSVSDNVIIKGFMWHGGVTAGDECKIVEGSDGSGNELFHAKLDVANGTVNAGFNGGIAASGFKLTVLGSGEVLIYIA